MSRNRGRNHAISLTFYLLAAAILFTGVLATLAIPIGSAYLFAINAITFGIFGWDKWQAKRSKERMPEQTLHGLALVGGSLGSLAGQSCFRHKRRKKNFQKIFWTIVSLQALTVVIVLLSR